MNTAKKFAITAVTGALLIALVLTILLLVLPDKTVADQQVYFTVADNSTEEAGVIQYVRVDENTPMTRSASNSYITKEVLAEKLDITLQDVEESVAITVQDVAMSQNENGEIEYLAGKINDKKIINGNDRKYIIANAIIMQKPSLNDIEVNKETGEIISFKGYGFELTMKMRWSTPPSSRGDDNFTYYMSGANYNYDNIEFEVPNTFTVIDTNTGQSYSYTEYCDYDLLYQGLLPVFQFNLYNDRIKEPVSIISVDCTAIMYVYGDGDYSRFYMTYVHRNSGLGDISFSIGTDGFNVGATLATSFTPFQTQPLDVSIVKDPELEAVKKVPNE